MPDGSNNNPSTDKSSKVILGLDSKQRIKIYLWGTLGLFLAAIILTWAYLRPERWYSYTDKTSIQKSAKDVELGYVAWERLSQLREWGLTQSMLKKHQSQRMVLTWSTVLASITPICFLEFGMVKNGENPVLCAH